MSLADLNRYFTPSLVNNTDPVDFIIYTLEQGNPKNMFATAFWGSVVQFYLFGIITVLALRYYFRFVGEDGRIKIGMVSILVLCTIAGLVVRQYSTYMVMSNVSPITGHGVQDVERLFWESALAEQFIVAIGQPVAILYFSHRAYELWGQKIWFGASLAAGALVTLALGLLASIYGRIGGPNEIWVNGRIDLVQSLRHAKDAVEYMDKTYQYMAAWSIASLILDSIITIALIAGMYKHRRRAQGMRNMENVKSTLRRGMFYLVESMAVPLAIQIVHSALTLRNVGFSSGLRATLSVRMPLHAFPVIYSLLSRSQLKEMLNATGSGGSAAISFSTTGSLHQMKANRSERTADPHGQDRSTDVEMYPYDSKHRLVDEEGKA